MLVFLGFENLSINSSQISNIDKDTPSMDIML